MRTRVLTSLVVGVSVAITIGAGQANQSGVPVCYSGVHVVSRLGRPDVANGYLTIADGVISGDGDLSRPPAKGAPCRADLAGKFIVPGFISAHAHVPDAPRTLEVFARYGVTTIWSLGGEPAAAFEARAAQDTPALARARIYLAGQIVTAQTVDAARQQVAAVAATRPDVIKIRVDDNLGTTAKMPPDVYRAVIQEAHARGLRVAAHIFYLDDAKDLLRAGVDVIAHSVRDREIDDEFISLMTSRGVPYIPTLTRELATFVYESAPAFFADPFFLREADPALIERLKEPARQQAMRDSTSARRYKAALPVAQRNLKRAADAGVLIAMGTDSGAQPERFPGYFEHVEMDMMVQSGLTPAQVLLSATGQAAKAMKLDAGGGVGTLAPGAWADFVVLDRDPRADIRNTRSISAVYIAGKRIPR